MTGPLKPTRVAELVLLAVLSALLLWVMWPFAAALFWAVALAIMLDPVWQWVQQRVKAPRWLQAILTILMLLVIIILPIVGFAAMLPAQIDALSAELPELRASFERGIAGLHDMLPPTLARLLDTVLHPTGSADEAAVQIGTVMNNVAGWLSGFAFSAVSTFVMLTITLYVLYFFLVDGRQMVARIFASLPFESRFLDMLGLRFLEITKATVGGVFVIAIAQGVVCGVILAILGVGQAVLLGTIAMIASLIPAIGSGLVWVPVSIYLLSQGEFARAGALLLCGIFIISMVDNLLRPRLVGQGARIPDFLILVTTLGGLQLMGASGIVLGPMIAGLCLSVWQAQSANND